MQQQQQSQQQKQLRTLCDDPLRVALDGQHDVGGRQWVAGGGVLKGGRRYSVLSLWYSYNFSTHFPNYLPLFFVLHSRSRAHSHSLTLIFFAFSFHLALLVATAFNRFTYLCECECASECVWGRRDLWSDFVCICSSLCRGSQQRQLIWRIF